MVSRRSQSVPQETFVVVRFAEETYRKFPDDVFSARDITHLCGAKPLDGGVRPKMPYVHSPGMGFARGQLYILRTAKDATDGNIHEYIVYIGASSGTFVRLRSREELVAILADKTQSEEKLKWPVLPETPSDLESGCESEDPNVQQGKLLAAATKNARDQRSARQEQHIKSMEGLLQTGHLDMLTPGNVVPQGDPWKLVKTLQAQVKLQEREKHEREEALKRIENVEKRRAEELRQKEEELRRKEEALNERMKRLDRLDSFIVSIENLQSDVSLIKEKISEYPTYKKSYVDEWVRNLPML
ncbi:Reticulocyte-binding protein 2-like protein a [Frankliniella fusca]|uniref:Reticulocyte-binding protein 2-like protein a n=1 Tax=Frankliniella fusca TaxID=407009 RepID=A0AAE1HBJ7_9NEOP|nr:Reticulocyte-binding protein 2-like protein a [Frankliniella fusca]